MGYCVLPVLGNALKACYTKELILFRSLRIMKQKRKNVNPQMAVAAAELNQALRTRFKASVIPNKKKRPHEPKKIKSFKPADGRFFSSLGTSG